METRQASPSLPKGAYSLVLGFILLIASIFLGFPHNYYTLSVYYYPYFSAPTYVPTIVFFTCVAALCIASLRGHPSLGFLVALVMVGLVIVFFLVRNFTLLLFIVLLWVLALTVAKPSVRLAVLLLIGGLVVFGLGVVLHFPQEVALWEFGFLMVVTAVPLWFFTARRARRLAPPAIQPVEQWWGERLEIPVYVPSGQEEEAKHERFRRWRAKRT